MQNFSIDGFAFHQLVLISFGFTVIFVLFFESNTSRPAGDSSIQESENIFSFWFYILMHKL